jgi:hypothetical protein
VLRYRSGLTVDLMRTTPLEACWPVLKVMKRAPVQMNAASANLDGARGDGLKLHGQPIREVVVAELEVCAPVHPFEKGAPVVGGRGVQLDVGKSPARVAERKQACRNESCRHISLPASQDAVEWRKVWIRSDRIGVGIDMPPEVQNLGWEAQRSHGVFDLPQQTVFHRRRIHLCSEPPSGDADPVQKRADRRGVDGALTADGESMPDQTAMLLRGRSSSGSSANARARNRRPGVDISTFGRRRRLVSIRWRPFRFDSKQPALRLGLDGDTIVLGSWEV